jgi:cell surface protein SprA
VPQSQSATGDAAVVRYPFNTSLSRETLRFAIFLASLGLVYSFFAFRYPGPKSSALAGNLNLTPGFSSHSAYAAADSNTQPNVVPRDSISGAASIDADQQPVSTGQNVAPEEAPGDSIPASASKPNDSLSTGTPQDTLPSSAPARKDSLPNFNPHDRMVDTTNESVEDSLIHGNDSTSIIRGRSYKKGGSDSLRARKDSTRADSNYVVCYDSTARLDQFHYKPPDSPTARFFSRQQYPLLLDINSPAYQREVTLDSTGSYVTVHEKFNSKDIRVPQTLALDDYVKQRFLEERANNWRSLAHDYRAGKRGDDLAGLFGSITSISIPVPANPLFSIFGKNEIDLHVTGEVDIRAAFKNQKSDQTTISSADQSQSEPDFNQDVQITVNGMIGDKLKIGADWNTQRTFEYENQLKINYTGYDDEIIQSVEAGNVSMSNTPSLIGGGEALFGIKTKLQSGPLTLTALVSQKKGQAKEVTVSGGSSSSSREIRVQDYATNNYFIDPVYKGYFEDIYSTVVPVQSPLMQANTIVDMDVWVSTAQYSSSQDRTVANAFINLPPRRETETYPDSFQVINNDSVSAGSEFHGYFVKLSTDKYKFNKLAGYITFKDNSIDQLAVAVSYRITSSGDGKTVYGVFTPDTSRVSVLKLIKPAGTLTPDVSREAWNLQMKNIYNIGSDIKESGFSFDVYYRQPSATDNKVFNGVPLLQAMGLDKYSSDKTTQTPDGVFDFLSGVTIDQQYGNIIFPSLRPFDTGLKKYYLENKKILLSDSTLIHEVYDTSLASMANVQKNFFVMKVVGATAQSSRISLGGFNIVEGSVQVLLNGSPLTAGDDYVVDYIVGEVTLKSERALAPGANLSIKYEQNDLFQLASKTLMGARGILDVSPNVNFGFTIMNLSQASLSDKVRIGEEPTKNTIMGIDGGFTSKLPFLTSAIDALPFIRAKEMSTLTFRGEAAYILPDANTRKSTVASDNNESVAYIDDFEGAKRTIPFPVSFASWTLGSPPYYSLLDTSLSNRQITDSVLTFSKAGLFWYNNTSSLDPVNVHEIWPAKSVATEDQFTSVLELDYNPLKRGAYNYSPDLATTLHRNDPVERRKNWNGIMKYIATTAGDLVGQNMQFLELWINPDGNQDADTADTKYGKLFVDLGRISEDVIPNGTLNSEDIIPTSSNPGGIPTGRVQPGADLGLDMLSDDQERSKYAAFLESNRNDPDYTSLQSDPSGDDFSYTTSTSEYTHYNGTEGNYNGGSTAGRFPDTEDLNGNSYVDAVNNYLEYEIPLTKYYVDSVGVTKLNPFVVGGNYSSSWAPNKNWYKLLIPLRNRTRSVSPGNDQTDDAILQNVQYVRLWLSGFASSHRIRIAQMELVGNQWVEAVKDDSTFKVSVVNVEDNPGVYFSPPGVDRPVDKTRPDQNIQGNEQSLALILNNIPQGESRMAVKVNSGKSVDLFNYKAMKMFVYGDNSFHSTPDQHDAEIFLRFGADASNYYEYRQAIAPGWHELTINFSDLTTIKSARDNAAGIKIDSLYRSGNNGIRGKPALTAIQYFSIGVTNPVAPNGVLYLSSAKEGVWVNELRVVGVDNSTGYAYHFDGQMKLSDFGNVAFNYAYTDPNFHSIDTRVGDRIEHRNWAVNTNFSFDKYFPLEMQGTSLSVSYSHQETITKPKYLPGTDILVTAAAQNTRKSASDSLTLSSQSLHTSDSYSLGTVRIVLPVKAWYVNETFNKLSYSFSFNRSSDRSPTIFSNKAWSWVFGVKYGTTVTADPSIQPFKALFNGVFLLDAYKDWKIYYFPLSSLSAGVDASRSGTLEVNRDPNVAIRESRAFSASKSLGFGWRATENGLLSLSGDYGLSISRDLLYLDNDSAGRGFQRILKDIFVGGRDGGYSQRVTVNSKPRIPNIFEIPKYLDLTAAYNVSYDWRNIFQSGDVGKSARWSNNITLSSSVRLKALADSWFKGLDSPSQQEPARSGPPPGVPQGPPPGAPPSKTDSTKSTKDTTSTPGKPIDLMAPLRFAAKYLVKVPFLDYETISVQFGQQNSSSNAGILGSAGFSNFWLRSPLQGSLVQNGPSRLYQLGLISDPSGTLNYQPTSKFPFLGWTTTPGLRAANATLTDQFTQSNNVTLHTTKPLWEGASLDINWKVGWSYNRQTVFNTDSYGVDTSSTISTGGSISRSFISMPPVFFLKYLKSNLEDVGKKYDKALSDSVAPDIALADAFEKGLEAAPFLNKILGQYVPRANWSFRWNGLQRISFLGSVFKELTLDHAYNSEFSKTFRGNADGSDRTDAERVTYSFNPLIGLSGTPKDFFGGNVSGSFKYGTSTIYDLNISSQNITETLTKDFAFSLNYGRHGFSIPFFGLNLVNDVDITFTYSISKNARTLFDPTLLSSNAEGTPLEGTTRTSMEPRFRYGLSSRVTASLFYRFTSVQPDEGGSTTFGTTTNEAGVDIHISIQ